MKNIKPKSMNTNGKAERWPITPIIPITVKMTPIGVKMNNLARCQKMYDIGRVIWAWFCKFGLTITLFGSGCGFAIFKIPLQLGHRYFPGAEEAN